MGVVSSMVFRGVINKVYILNKITSYKMNNGINTDDDAVTKGSLKKMAPLFQITHVDKCLGEVVDCLFEERGGKLVTDDPEAIVTEYGPDTIEYRKCIKSLRNIEYAGI